MFCGLEWVCKASAVRFILLADSCVEDFNSCCRFFFGLDFA